MLWIAGQNRVHAVTLRWPRFWRWTSSNVGPKYFRMFTSWRVGRVNETSFLTYQSDCTCAVLQTTPTKRMRSAQLGNGNFRFCKCWLVHLIRVLQFLSCSEGVYVHFFWFTMLEHKNVFFLFLLTSFEIKGSDKKIIKNWLKQRICSKLALLLVT